VGRHRRENPGLSTRLRARGVRSPELRRHRVHGLEEDLGIPEAIRLGDLRWTIGSRASSGPTRPRKHSSRAPTCKQGNADSAKNGGLCTLFHPACGAARTARPAKGLPRDRRSTYRRMRAQSKTTPSAEDVPTCLGSKYEPATGADQGQLPPPSGSRPGLQMTVTCRWQRLHGSMRDPTASYQRGDHTASVTAGTRTRYDTCDGWSEMGGALHGGPALRASRVSRKRRRRAANPGWRAAALRALGRQSYIRCFTRAGRCDDGEVAHINAPAPRDVHAAADANAHGVDRGVRTNTDNPAL